jgi:hypothetical protein
VEYAGEPLTGSKYVRLSASSLLESVRVPSHPHASKWILTWLGCVILAIIYVYFGARILGPTVPVVDSRGLWAIGGAVLVLLVKYGMSASRGAQYKRHEQGYDFCLMASGAAVPGFAGTLVSNSNDWKIWAGAAVGALVALILSSAFSKAAEDAANKKGWDAWEPNLWTIANTLGLGVPSFLGYMFLVVIKAQR